MSKSDRSYGCVAWFPVESWWRCTKSNLVFRFGKNCRNYNVYNVDLFNWLLIRKTRFYRRRYNPVILTSYNLVTTMTLCSDEPIRRREDRSGLDLLYWNRTPIRWRSSRSSSLSFRRREVDSDSPRAPQIPWTLEKRCLPTSFPQIPNLYMVKITFRITLDHVEDHVGSRWSA